MTETEFIVCLMELKELIEKYKLYLLNNRSKITVKNYISDLNHFSLWCDKNKNASNGIDLLSKSVINEYISSQTAPKGESDSNKASFSDKLSYKSFKRHLSSLKSFTAYLSSEGILEENPLITETTSQIANPWNFSEFKNYLLENKASDLTVKYYINDLKGFAKWCTETSLDKAFTDSNSLPINEELINEYTNRLQTTLFLSPKSINRKLSSLRRYISFMKLKVNQEEIHRAELAPKDSVNISELLIPEAVASRSRFAPVRLANSLLTPYVLLENKLAGTISSQIILMRLHSALKSTKSKNKQFIDQMVRGVNIKNIGKEFYAPREMSLENFPLHKKLIFHARHTRPEWYKKYHTYPFVHYVHFSVLVIAAFMVSSFLYNATIGSATADNSQTAGSISLNRTFAFRGKLLDKDGKPVTESSDIRLSLYNDSTATGSALLWQEVQGQVKPESDGSISLLIGTTTAIPDTLFESDTPLYLGVTIAEGNELYPRKQIGVAYANDSERVNGMLPITASDKQSNVLLAFDGSGDLNIGGDADHAMRTTGGDFTLSGQALILTTNAGAGGNVILNPYGNGKIDVRKPLTNSLGTLNAEGSFEISATTSATPVLSLKQDSSGDFITGTTAGLPRFTLNNQGVITKGIWAGEIIGTAFGGFGADITATGPGELLYSLGSKSYGHLAAGVAGQCLTSAGKTAPLWSNCGFLSQLNGAVSLTNNNMDFLIGASSTTSAKFAFTNVTSGTPTLKIGGGLSLTAEGSIETHDKDLRLGGNTTKNIILASTGNVGLGNSSPTRNLDVNGNWGGNVDFYSDGATTQTIQRNTKALIYDLEKNTGGTDTSTTTTYNIVGLPDNDGTIAFVYTKVEKSATPNPQLQTIIVQVNGTQVATLSTNGGAQSSGPETDVKHFTLTRSNTKWHLIGDPGNSDTADLAEWTEYTGETPLPGELVSIGLDGKLIKSSTSYDKKIAGIVSTKPNITLGLANSQSVRLALSGRVPAVVVSINGTILSGDTITSSPISGAGMKLSKTGATVGKAVEGFSPNISKCTESESLSSISWPNDDGKNTLHPCFKVKVQNLNAATKQELLSTYGLTPSDYIYIGKVMILSGLSWSSSDDLLTSLETVSITDEPFALPIDGEIAYLLEQLQKTNQITKAGGKVITTIGAFSSLTSGSVKTGTLTAVNIGTKSLLSTKGIIGSLTVNALRVTDSIFVNGLSLNDYIAREFKSQKEISSPLAKINILKTNTITPKDGKTVTVSLPEGPDSALVIKNSDTNKDVITLGSNGDITAANASVSGALTSNTIDTNDASVSGTITTNRLVAKEIDGLDEKLTSVASKLIANSKTQNIPAVQFNDQLNEATISAQFGTFYGGLLSLGASTFGNLSIMDNLSIGTTLIFSPNSINTLGVDLEIQPLKQGAVSFLAGAVKINLDGTLTVSEDALFNKNVLVRGRLSANLLSPLADQDIQVNLPKGKNKDSSFTVTNSTNSAVLAVNQAGDVVASGSGTFSKLNFSLVGQALASNQYEAVATGSAGTAILKANTLELTIKNPLVTDKSLIYITPANSTGNQVMYLMRQTPNASFTVGLSQIVPQDILFNWLIVN